MPLIRHRSGVADCEDVGMARHRQIDADLQGASAGGGGTQRKANQATLMLPPPRKKFLPSTSPHVRNSPDCGLKIGGDVTAALYQLRTHAVQQGASHSITSSASVSSIGGTVRPSVFAVLRLITKSNFIGCCTGRSAGFVPRKILSM